MLSSPSDVSPSSSSASSTTSSTAPTALPTLDLDPFPFSLHSHLATPPPDSQSHSLSLAGADDLALPRVWARPRPPLSIQHPHQLTFALSPAPGLIPTPVSALPANHLPRPCSPSDHGFRSAYSPPSVPPSSSDEARSRTFLPSEAVPVNPLTPTSAPPQTALGHPDPPSLPARPSPPTPAAHSTFSAAGQQQSSLPGTSSKQPSVFEFLE